MKLKSLSDVVVGMQGRMPESSRFTLASLILKAISLDLQEKDGILVEEWRNSGAPQRFMQECCLASGPANVPHDISIHDSDLAAFCNKWMNVEQYREAGGEWRPVTPEMHQMRFTIIQDLLTFAKSELHSDPVVETDR